jgi:dienelactone hydrolase
MCFDLDSLPPVSRIAGAAVSHNDRRYEEFAEASEDAWRRVLEFLEAHSA